MATTISRLHVINLGYFCSTCCRKGLYMAGKRHRRLRKQLAMMGATATVAALAMGVIAPAASAQAAPTFGDVLTADPTGVLGGIVTNDLTTAEFSAALAALDDSGIDPASVGIDGDLIGEIWRAISIGPLLQRLGIDLSDVISNLILSKVPATGDGVNLVLTGPLMGALEFIGANPYWVPAFADQVSAGVNGTPYGIKVTSPITLQLDNFRLPIVAGIGPGAFAVGNAYQGVVDDIPNQTTNTRTILPLILLRNPGRPDGGLAARAEPLLQLLGITSVSPDVATFKDNDTDKRIVWPLKVDATFEYDWMSDVPSWPNPVALLNTGVGAVFPTYILRNDDAESIADQIVAPLLAELTGANAFALLVGSNPPAALNGYVTIAEPSLPLFEPTRLPVDLVNLVAGTNFSNPLADALEPAAKILVNLGYVDVDQANPTYDRTLDHAGVLTPFFTMPDVDWSLVPGDLVDALQTGFGDAFLSGGVPGMPSTPQGNPLKAIADVVGGATAPTPAETLTAAASDALATSAKSKTDKADPESAGAATKAPAKRPLLNVVRDIANMVTPGTTPGTSTGTTTGPAAPTSGGDATDAAADPSPSQVPDPADTSSPDADDSGTDGPSSDAGE